MENEHPILFTGPMVRAILEGRKTQTRRVVKPQPLDVLTKREPWAKTATRNLDGRKCWAALYERNPNRGRMIYCRLGEAGNQLWVRETWLEYDKSIRDGDVGFYYRATTPGTAFNGSWKPSIFMPRKASRITLEIVNVRVERVQEISEEDAMAEGCKIGDVVSRWPDGHILATAGTHRSAYSSLWDRLNAKRGFGWGKNPWVWVIEFKGL